MSETLERAVETKADIKTTTVNIKVDTTTPEMVGIDDKSKFQIKERDDGQSTLNFNGNNQPPVDAQISHNGDIMTCMAVITVTAEGFGTAQTTVVIAYNKASKEAELLFVSPNQAGIASRTPSPLMFPPNGTGTGSGGGVYP